MDKRLVTYLESEAFKFQLEEFFEVFNHKGFCGDKGFAFQSEVVEEFNCIDWKANLEKRLLDDMLKLYFEKRHFKSDRQLFAVILGYAFNLTYNQMLRIGNRKSSMRSWKVLNYFLCHRTEQSYEVKNLLNCNNITYYVYMNGKKFAAKYEKGCVFSNCDYLRLNEKGFVFEIV